MQIYAYFAIVYVFTIIYNCHHQCTLGYLLSLLSVLAMFFTKDLIYFSTTVTAVLPWTQTHPRRVVIRCAARILEERGPEFGYQE